jgi:hypothetical protein
MASFPVVVLGLVNADGTLEVKEKITLPPGRVRVTVESVPDAEPSRPDVLTVLASIHREQAAAGTKGRTKEEIDAYLYGLREEREQRLEEIGRLQAGAPRAGEKPAC